MTLVLPRFQQASALVDENGLPTIAFHIWWDTFASNLEQAFNDLSDNVAAIAAAQATADTAIANAASAAADAAAAAAQALSAANDALAAQTAANTAQSTATTAQTTATTANTTANTANTTANTVTRNDKITASSIIPANVLAASDAGTDASIVVSAHTRIYGDASQLSVGGHTFTGLAYSTSYGIYYDDVTCTDTTPTYHTTTTLSNALNNFVAGRHFVGTVTTPASGGTATSGGTSPPGYGGGDRSQLSSI